MMSASAPNIEDESYTRYLSARKVDPPVVAKPVRIVKPADVERTVNRLAGGLAHYAPSSRREVAAAAPPSEEATRVGLRTPPREASFALGLRSAAPAPAAFTAPSSAASFAGSDGRPAPTGRARRQALARNRAQTERYVARLQGARRAAEARKSTGFQDGRGTLAFEPKLSAAERNMLETAASRKIEKLQEVMRAQFMQDQPPLSSARSRKSEVSASASSRSSRSEEAACDSARDPRRLGSRPRASPRGLSHKVRSPVRLNLRLPLRAESPRQQPHGRNEREKKRKSPRRRSVRSVQRNASESSSPRRQPTVTSPPGKQRQPSRGDPGASPRRVPAGRRDSGSPRRRAGAARGTCGSPRRRHPQGAPSASPPCKLDFKPAVRKEKRYAGLEEFDAILAGSTPTKTIAPSECDDAPTPVRRSAAYSSLGDLAALTKEIEARCAR